MRVRRFLFAVRSKGSCPWACQSVEAQGCAKDARHGGKPWQLFANNQQRGHVWHRRNAAWRLGRAWWGLVGLGYFATLSGLIGLAGKYFAQVFSGLRGRMPAGGTHWQKSAAWVRTRLHRCQTRQGMPCLRNTDQASGKKARGKRHILPFPGIWRQILAANRHLLLACKITLAAAHRAQYFCLQKQLRRNNHKKGGTRRLPL